MSTESKTIRNCHFRYRCHMEWGDLDEMGNPTVRHCGICSKDVHLCSTESELAKAIAANLCVAIPGDAVERYSHDTASPLLGRDYMNGLLLGDIIIPEKE